MGGSKQTQTTNQTTTQRRSPYSARVVNQQLGAAENVYQNRLNSPSFYPGQSVTDFNPYSTQAMEGMASRAQAGSPLVRNAQGVVNDTLQGNYLNAGNPYFASMANRITENVLPSITAQWAGAGRGTGNNQVVEAASQGLGDAIGQLAYQNYGQERANQMAAIGMAPQLAAQDYYDLERLDQVGQVYEGKERERIADAMARWQAGQDQESNALREYMGFTEPINQAYGTQVGNTQGTTTSQTQQSPWQTALGLGMMAAAPFSGGASLGGMSMLGGMGNMLGNRPWSYQASNPGWGATVTPSPYMAGGGYWPAM